MCCTQCQSQTVRKNGSIHSGKQKYKCLACHKQFVEEPQNKIISDDIKERIRRSLLERVSLEGICRIFDVSMPWLLGFMEKTFQSLPEDLNATIIAENDEFEVAVLEGDEMWSFVGSKSNDQWLWLVMHSSTRQILAFHVGKRNKAAGEALIAKLPEGIKKKAHFYTDKFSVYYEVIPWSQHSAVGKESGKTSYIERFNCTLRQRCSRLVRKALSFSKKLENHIGAIKMFICNYNKNLKSLHI
ncbi:IS1 family transposase [Candidatus Protochlamydia naegleriophila]|uniref:IS1 family transposase n=1 Tax=Candidatus Protochlamydia naegleriophila TaxID=389348 RepID=UPI001300F86E|nr:IS1 family transposase [Candidatus Protochlamydia naegleriophila]